MLLALAAAVPSPAHADDVPPVHSWPRDAKAIEAALARLGLPVGPVDGVWDRDTARATCMWRELTGRKPLRSWPVVAERPAVKATTTLTPIAQHRIGVNINIQCQAATWVETQLVESATVRTRLVVVPAPIDTTTAIDTSTVVETMTVTETYTVTKLIKQRTVVRVMPVSSGQSGIYDTGQGSFRVQWSVNRWWQSTIYADGLMYRPFFFNGGQALHGSINDTLVKWYPASHGCVRMLHKDIDALWDAGFGRGDRVYVYGAWKG